MSSSHCCAECANKINNNDKQKPDGVRIISCVISIMLLLAAIIIEHTLKMDYFWLFALLYASAVIAAGYKVFYKAARNILSGEFFDENFLMTIAAIGAFVLGLVWRTGGEEMMDAVLVMLLYAVGEFFESLAVGKSKGSIKALLSLRADFARILQDGKEIKVSPDKVMLGDIIIVRAGERIPLDGEVVLGEGYVDKSAVTGESAPEFVTANSSAVSGSISLDGLLKIKVTAVFGESTVSRMLRLVEQAAENKSKEETFITKFAKFYTPLVVIGAVAVAVLPPLFIGAFSGFSGEIWSEWVYRALSLLIISCPCALVIAVPVTFFGGIGGLARRGILVKGSSGIMPLSRVKTVVFDKTGTLTYGKFEVVRVLLEPNISERELYLLAASAEKNFSHPIAQSITKAAEKFGDNPYIATDVKDIAGKGVRAVIGGKELLCGNNALLLDNGIDFAPPNSPYTTVFCAYGGKYLGCFIIADVIKPESALAVKELKSMGIRTVMLTGDKFSASESVANELGIDEFHSQLLPSDKARLVQEMRSRGETVQPNRFFSLLLRKKAMHPRNQTVMFVGDGINDAPVLMTADVGAAMGGLGSDAAIEASDLVISSDNPLAVVTAILQSKKIGRVAYQNIVGTLLIKAAIMSLALSGVSPGLWLAIVADVGVTLAAILNALRAAKPSKNVT